MVRIISVFRAAARRIHNRDSHRHICNLAFLGIEQRRCNVGGTKPQAKKAERASILAHRLLQHDLSGSVRYSSSFTEPIVRLFTQDATVVPLAAKCLRIVSYGNIGYAYGMVMLQAFNGAGDTVTPTIVNFFGFWLLEIPLAYWLAIRMRVGPNGAFWSIVVAEAAIAGASAVLFKRGNWKAQKI
jgi:Na+-driven multidrug efflux pump